MSNPRPAEQPQPEPMQSTPVPIAGEPIKQEPNGPQQILKQDEGESLRKGESLKDEPAFIERRKSRRAEPAEKAKAVVRVLSGESKESVAADLKVAVERLERWQTTFYRGGVDALERASSRKSGKTTWTDKAKVHTGGTVRQWLVLVAILVAAIAALVWLLTP
jgi:hypothetical protein